VIIAFITSNKNLAVL